MTTENLGLIKPTLQITLFSVIGIIISFISQMIIAYYFGTEFERDAYFIAIIIPTYITSIFIGSFGIIFLPKVIDVMSGKNRESLSEFISSTFLLLIAILIFLTLGCIFFSKEVISLFAQGYDANQIAFTSKILIVVIPTIIFSVLSNLLSSLYQIKHKFIRPALVPILSSTIGFIFVIILSEKIGIFGLAFGYLSGSLISFIALLPILKIYDFKFRFNYRNVDILSYIKTLTPLLLTSILFRSGEVIERMIASTLENGSISFLGYSNQILAALVSVTATSVGVIAYPSLSKLWSERKINELVIFFEKTIRIILLISIPIVLSIIVFGDQFIKAIFERGAFNSSNTIAVSKVLSWSMGAFIFQSLGAVIMKMFYLSSKTITMSVIESLNIFIYILSSFLLSKYLSYVGLAMALSLSGFIAISLSLIIINKYLIKIRFFSLFRHTRTIIFISFLSIFMIYILYNYIIGVDHIVYLILCHLIGALGYILLGIRLGIGEILYMQKIIANKLIYKLYS